MTCVCGVECFISTPHSRLSRRVHLHGRALTGCRRHRRAEHAEEEEEQQRTLDDGQRTADNEGWTSSPSRRSAVREAAVRRGGEGGEESEERRERRGEGGEEREERRREQQRRICAQWTAGYSHVDNGWQESASRFKCEISLSEPSGRWVRQTLRAATAEQSRGDAAELSCVRPSHLCCSQSHLVPFTASLPPLLRCCPALAWRPSGLSFLPRHGSASPTGHVGVSGGGCLSDCAQRGRLCR